MRLIRNKVRLFLLEYVDRGDVVLADAVASAKAHFDADRGFRDMLFNEAIEAFVADDLRAIFTSRRPPGGAGVLREQRAAELLAQLQESVGAGARKSILNMTRPEGLYSIELRERRIASEQVFIAFERDIFEGLPDDIVTVGEHYSDDDLQGKWEAFFA